MAMHEVAHKCRSWLLLLPLVTASLCMALWEAKHPHCDAVAIIKQACNNGGCLLFGKLDPLQPFVAVRPVFCNHFDHQSITQ